MSDAGKRRYRYEEDAEAQACVAAASEAWRDTFARYYHIPGTDKGTQDRRPASNNLPTRPIQRG